MRSERTSQGDLETSHVEYEALKQKRHLAQDYSRGKKRSHRKRASASQKINGIGHRRQKKWAW